MGLKQFDWPAVEVPHNPICWRVLCDALIWQGGRSTDRRWQRQKTQAADDGRDTQSSCRPRQWQWETTDANARQWPWQTTLLGLCPQWRCWAIQVIANGGARQWQAVAVVGYKLSWPAMAKAGTSLIGMQPGQWQWHTTRIHVQQMPAAARNPDGMRCTNRVKVGVTHGRWGMLTVSMSSLGARPIPQPTGSRFGIMAASASPSMPWLA